jgi:alginate O-acetyltransferase complex protein AlgI
MTALIVFRPLKNRVGTRTAMLTAFLFSGALHELAISVPVRACYGLPFLYFVLQAIAMEVENFLSQRNSTWLARPRTGWCWTLLWLLVPLPILFHTPFLAGCVGPLIGLTVAE